MSLDRWERHIIHRHGELIDHSDSIRKGLESPDLVLHDARFPTRESYYTWGIVEGYERYYLKVSVEFSEDHETPTGTVITAYISRNIKPGETLKWHGTK